MLPSGSIFDFIARVTSLPKRETESPALDYGDPLRSFWKHSPSLLSHIQGIKLNNVMNKVCDRPNRLSKFCHHHSGAVWSMSTPGTRGSIWMDPCRVWSSCSLSSGGKIPQVARTRRDSQPWGIARHFGAPITQLWTRPLLLISKQAVVMVKPALAILLAAKTPWTQKKAPGRCTVRFSGDLFFPKLTPVSPFLSFWL